MAFLTHKDEKFNNVKVQNSLTLPIVSDVELISNGSIGSMVLNKKDGALYFATHPEGRWVRSSASSSFSGDARNRVIVESVTLTGPSATANVDVLLNGFPSQPGFSVTGEVHYVGVNTTGASVGGSTNQMDVVLVSTTALTTTTVSTVSTGAVTNPPLAPVYSFPGLNTLNVAVTNDPTLGAGDVVKHMLTFNLSQISY